MTPEQYIQEARKTMLPQCENIEYLEHGLWSEIGELDALFKRAIRDQKEVDREEVKKEIGDVLWYALNLAEMESAWCKPTSWPSSWAASPSTFFNMSNIRAAAIDRYTYGIAFHLSQLSFLFGLTIEECAVANIEKLRSRHERGVITGKGGDR